MTTAVGARFQDAYAALKRHVEGRYAVPILVTRIQPPLKGDLDGSRILVGDHNTDEERLFLVAHLFGHTVQWNLSAELRRILAAGPAPDRAARDSRVHADAMAATRAGDRFVRPAKIPRDANGRLG